MNTQQLAEYLETYGPKSNIDRTALLAAAELRRLHEENERLKAQQQEPVAYRFKKHGSGNVFWYETTRPKNPEAFDVKPLYTAQQ